MPVRPSRRTVLGSAGLVAATTALPLGTSPAHAAPAAIAAAPGAR